MLNNSDSSVSQLSKEDEAAAEEVEVRREDQEKINKFSRLHQRESLLEEQLKQKQVCSSHDFSELLAKISTERQGRLGGDRQ
jgi:prefoldin subunit 4